MPSPHLNIPHVADTAQKAPTQNESVDLLDRAFNQVLDLDVSAGGVIVLTTDQAEQNFAIRCTGAPATPVTLIIPAEQRTFGVINQTHSPGQIVTLQPDQTAGTLGAVGIGGNAIFSSDGENATVIASTEVNDSGLIEAFSGFIEVPTEKTYVLEQSAPVAYSIIDIVGILVAGSMDVTIEINGTPVTSMDANTHNTGEQTFTATALNAVALGDVVTMVITDLDTGTAADFSFSMKTQRD